MLGIHWNPWADFDKLDLVGKLFLVFGIIGLYATMHPPRSTTAGHRL